MYEPYLCVYFGFLKSTEYCHVVDIRDIITILFVNRQITNIVLLQCRR